MFAHGARVCDTAAQTVNSRKNAHQAHKVHWALGAHSGLPPGDPAGRSRPHLSRVAGDRPVSARFSGAGRVRAVFSRLATTRYGVALCTRTTPARALVAVAWPRRSANRTIVDPPAAGALGFASRASSSSRSRIAGDVAVPGALAEQAQQLVAVGNCPRITSANTRARSGAPDQRANRRRAPAQPRGAAPRVERGDVAVHDHGGQALHEVTTLLPSRRARATTARYGVVTVTRDTPRSRCRAARPSPTAAQPASPSTARADPVRVAPRRAAGPAPRRAGRRDAAPPPPP